MVMTCRVLGISYADRIAIEPSATAQSSYDFADLTRAEKQAAQDYQSRSLRKKMKKQKGGNPDNLRSGKPLL